MSVVFVLVSMLLRVNDVIPSDFYFSLVAVDNLMKTFFFFKKWGI